MHEEDLTSKIYFSFLPYLIQAYVDCKCNLLRVKNTKELLTGSIFDLFFKFTKCQIRILSCS